MKVPLAAERQDWPAATAPTTRSRRPKEYSSSPSLLASKPSQQVKSNLAPLCKSPRRFSQSRSCSSVQRGRIAQPLLGARVAGAPQRRGRAHHRQKILGDECGTCEQLRCILALAGGCRADQLDTLSRRFGLEGSVGCRAVGRLRDARQRLSADCSRELRGTPAGQLTEDGCGFPAMINTVLPLFNLGTASVALGLCRAAVATTANHLQGAQDPSSGRYRRLALARGGSLRRGPSV